MEKGEIKKLLIVFGLVLLVAIGIDCTKETLTEDGTILRNAVGEEEREVNLSLDVEGIGSDYDYTLEVEPMRVTCEEAEQYFLAAIEEIEEDFLVIEDTVPMKEEYQKGIVDARWNVDSWNAIQSDGTIVQEEIPEEGLLVNASVTLSCGEYEKIYQFAFEIFPQTLSQEQKIFTAIEEWLDAEMAKEGENVVRLPGELLGISLSWSEKKESLTIKILFLEIVAVVALLIAKHQKKEKEEKELMQKIEFDYPEVVSQLTLLLGAGMNVRQAWNRIATRYSDKRQKKQISKKPAYEGILRLDRRIQEGENEKVAYQKFANEMKNMSYHRLVRLLINNMEKGTSGICELLEQESKQAYEQRILQAKKLGEEASTRMLMPLMLMMVVVMTIVMIPAIISFAG